MSAPPAKPMSKRDIHFALAVYILFMGGWDSADLAAKLSISEAEVVRWIELGRFVQPDWASPEPVSKVDGKAGLP